MLLNSKKTQDVSSQKLEKNSVVSDSKKPKKGKKPKKSVEEMLAMECITKCKDGWRVRKIVNHSEFDVFFKTLKPAQNFRDLLNNLQVNRPGTNEYKKAYDKAKGKINIFWGDVVAAYLKFVKLTKSNGTFLTYSKRCLKYLPSLANKDFREITREEIIELINGGSNTKVKRRISLDISQISKYCMGCDKWKEHVTSAPWEGMEYDAIVKRIAPSDSEDNEVSEEKEISSEDKVDENENFTDHSDHTKLMSFVMKSLKELLGGKIRKSVSKFGATIAATLFILLGRLAGLRPGESAVLYWADINFKECYIRVWCNRTILNGKTIRQEGVTKSGVGKERNVTISKRFRDMLKAVYERRDPTNPFVCSNHGEVATETVTNRLFKTFLRNAGIKEYHTPHNLRTTFATNFLRTNDTATGLLTLSRLLGHENLNTTKKYLVLIKSKKTKAVEDSTDKALDSAEESFELPSADQA